MGKTILGDAFKLCDDAGHGFENRNENSYDPGACSGGAEEADIALAFALTGKWMFERAGLLIFLTRNDDRDSTPVGLRDDQARRAGCSHFLSIHCNSSASETATGTETLYRDARDLEWARIVHAAALEALGLRDRGLKQESSIIRDGKPLRLAVLDFAPPACLLELGFISNAADRAVMLQRDTRIRFWNAVITTLKA
ncbi:MAG: N-acetylmuramoyl-L-alanine amidase [Pleurocapsa sp. SU_196_0]|nr:N-acetylmuramoyl-L-alanine amidase [Pleurocapsa sp. SU_196_0]